MPTKCAAGDRCGMPNVPLSKQPHECMQCGKGMHGGAFCGILWCERGDDVKIELECLSLRANKLCNVS